MKAEKTITCRVVELNKGKLEALEREYDKVQEYLQGEDVELYSATIQAVDKYTDWEHLKEDKEYPWHLRNDTFSVEKAKTAEEFDYWAKIPVKDVYGCIEVPVKPHEEIKQEYKIKDSKIVKKDYGFELHLSVSKEVERVGEYRGVVGIDLGLNKLAVSVSLPGRQTCCYGTQVGDTQARYYFLRRNCKNGYVRRKWDGKDKDKVEDICHQISRRVVDTAKEKNLLIVLGDLEEVQEQDKGRKMNRKLHSFPHWKLKKYIKYKARWEGVEVVEVSESYTSQRCSRCGEIGDRHKGKFKCPNCGLVVDSDKNGAHNIAVRGIGKFLETASDARSHVAWLEASTDEETSVHQVSEVAGNLSKRSEALSSPNECEAR